MVTATYRERVSIVPETGVPEDCVTPACAMIGTRTASLEVPRHSSEYALAGLPATS
jgi:hypothetical protein